MVSEAQAIANFKGRGLLRGGELYVSASDAAAYAAHCRKQGLAVIGVEGFVVDADTLVPQQDLIADASHVEADTWQSFREQSSNFTAKFLQRLPDRPDLMVNLTTLSEHEWRTGEA